MQNLLQSCQRDEKHFVLKGKRGGYALLRKACRFAIALRAALLSYFYKIVLCQHNTNLMLAPQAPLRAALLRLEAAYNL